jgi:opacity protein-like surface antigen
MKNIVLSTVAVLAMSSFAVAGGDIAPVEEPVVVVEPVVTDAGFYLGLAYSYMMSDVGHFDNNRNLGFNLDTDSHSIMLQAGYKFNSYVAIEGRYWEGLSDDAFAFDNTVTSRFDADQTAWGIYVKPMYPVTDSFDVYALLGYGEGSVNNVKDRSGTHDLDSDGFSWGIGAAYSFTENVSIFLDYVAFDDNDFDFANETYTYDHSMDTVNFGVTYKF